MSRVEFPTGIKIQEKKCAGNLQPLLSKLEKYAFNGYIHTMVNDQLEGYITLKDGIPRNALLYTPADKEIKGLSALKKIKDLGSMENILIEVHTNVDIDSLISSTTGKLEQEKVEDELMAEEQEDIIDRMDEKVEEEEKKKKEEKRKEIEKSFEIKNLEDELQRRIIEQEMKETDIEEKAIGVYDMLIKERKGIDRVEPGPFPERFSFENFIVGSNNKFAYAAAREVSRFPGETFNPLFITSSSGMGKTHLLKAIGHYIIGKNADAKVEYLTTANLSNLLSKKEFEEVIEAFKKADLLLLDDVQFLANRPELQEKIFYIFNSVKESGGQIVLASDRNPEEIPSLKDRLVSRFKSGLVVDIKPPRFETRRAIVEKMLSRYEAVVDDQVIDFIAERVSKNIRELEGALNKILAFSSLLDEKITCEIVKESLGDHEKGSKSDKRSAHSFLPGRSYLIEESRVERGFEILKGLSSSHSLHIFSRMNPQRIQEDFGLNGATIRWLTGRDSNNFETVSPNLESLTWHIEEIIKDGPVVLLDGIEYLIGQSSFGAAIQFIRHMVDVVSESDTIFLMTVSPDALERKQVSILEREMEVVHEE